jgi:hypothetical protein
MPPYPVLCQTCGAAAAFKIAAHWSDGITAELKTYSLCCGGCVAVCFVEARKRQAACPLELGETLDSPNVFELTRGLRDTTLTRRTDLETQEAHP